MRFGDQARAGRNHRRRVHYRSLQRQGRRRGGDEAGFACRGECACLSRRSAAAGIGRDSRGEAWKQGSGGVNGRIRLGVNIDHVATIRNARGASYPDPARAAFIALEAGADGITAHLREDRRHISDADIDNLAAMLRKRPLVAVAVL